MDIPNGMDTHYAFDGFGQMTSIEHKDGATVLDGWTYGMGGGAITSITADDGSRWAYEHDANSRLTKAERYDTDGTTLLHRYSYTYGDGDNLLTKAVYDAVATSTTTTTYAYNAPTPNLRPRDGGFKVESAVPCSVSLWPASRLSVMPSRSGARPRRGGPEGRGRSGATASMVFISCRLPQ